MQNCPSLNKTSSSTLCPNLSRLSRHPRIFSIGMLVKLHLRLQYLWCAFIQAEKLFYFFAVFFSSLLFFSLIIYFFIFALLVFKIQCQLCLQHCKVESSFEFINSKQLFHLVLNFVSFLSYFIKFNVQCV